MFKGTFKGLLLLLLFPLGLNGQSLAEKRINDYFNQVRGEFNKEDAWNTVAFVEKFWRIPGNKGFDSSIYHLRDKLLQAGYKDDPGADLSFQIEKRPMENLTWEPIGAYLKLKGENERVLDFSSNRNMIAINSWSVQSPGHTVNAQFVMLEPGMEIRNGQLNGKIMLVEGSPYRYYNLAVENGAIGIMSYNMPDYLKPGINQNSIQFRSIPQNTDHKLWSIALSFEAWNRLKRAWQAGNNNLEVYLETKLYSSDELTLIAKIKGRKFPEQLLVYSAHVQEPGANDNASGVGAQIEMAMTAARLFQKNERKPDRTIVFLFGDEISSTRRFVDDFKPNIKWGFSLDMVGENTDKTGGSFLIEKMPDPSAVWTRGQDKHTEWGGQKLSKDDIMYHYLNDLSRYVFDIQGEYSDWIVNENPYEGGSDHIPFLRAQIPGLLFWHFTDQFYHTDQDRIDKVSSETLENVGVSALTLGYLLSNSDQYFAKGVAEIIKSRGLSRLKNEFQLGKKLITQNQTEANMEAEILDTWAAWYVKSIRELSDMLESEEEKNDFQRYLKPLENELFQQAEEYINALN